jgi:hypothetical protein
MKESRGYADAYQRAMTALVPARTESYTPVMHTEIMTSMKANLGRQNLTVVGQKLHVNGKGTKVIGFYDVEDRGNFGNAHGLKMMLGYRNSYDKSMSVGIVVGASVWICSNGCISGDMLTFKRKHTGEVQTEMNEKIQEGIQRMRNDFGKLNIEVDIFKNYSLTQRQKSEILGVMYFEQDLVTPQQLSLVKKELTQSEHFKDNTAWDLYNNVTEALKTSHPTNVIDDHVNLHRFMRSVVGIEEAEVISESDGSEPQGEV